MDMMIRFEQISTGIAVVTHARDCLLYIIPWFLLALLLKSLLQLSNFRLFVLKTDQLMLQHTYFDCTL